MNRFYDRLFYVFLVVVILSRVYPPLGDSLVSFVENFGVEKYLNYFIAIIIIFGIVKFLGSSLKDLLISDKSKRKSRRQIKKEERREEKSSRFESRNSSEYSKLAWTGGRVFHTIISFTITFVVYAFYGELITELSVSTQTPTTFLYIGLGIGVYVIIRYSVNPLIWLFAGNKDKW